MLATPSWAWIPSICNFLTYKKQVRLLPNLFFMLKIRNKSFVRGRSLLGEALQIIEIHPA